MKRFFTISYAALLSLALLCGTTACKDDETPGPGEPAPEILRIDVTAVTIDDAVVTVTPVYGTTLYIAAVDFAADFDAATVVATNKAAFAENAAAEGQTLAAFIEGYAFKGTQTVQPPTLSPKTDYVVYAYGIDGEGNATTDVFTREFTTQPVPDGEKVDCTIDIRIENLTDVSADVTFAPTANGVYYYYTVTDQAGYDDISKDWNGYIYNYITSRVAGGSLTLEEVVKVLCTSGEKSSRAKGLSPGTTYYACAVGVGMDALLITDVAVKAFTTETEYTIDYSFEATVGDITSRSAKVEIEPRTPTAFYYWNVMTQADFDTLGKDEAKIAAWFKQMMDAKRRADFGEYADYYPLPDYIADQCSDKPDSYTFTGLSASTDYYVYAFWVDQNSGEIVSATWFSTPFRTLDKVVSPATATAVLWLTDGDDWAALSPTGYAHFAGKAILGARITPGSEAVHWYSNIFNAADLEKYTDDQFVTTLLKSPYKDKTSYYLSYSVEWGGEYAIVSVAEDAAGNLGEVTKKTFTAEKSAAEPLTELPE